MKIDVEGYVLIFEEKIFDEIQSFAGDMEKIGYLFIYNILGTKEIVISEITHPHEKDISTPVYSEICSKHARIAKRKIKESDNTIASIGFYHTHPVSYGVKPSQTDIDHFEHSSRKALLKVFIIATSKELAIYIYKYGVCTERIKWK